MAMLGIAASIIGGTLNIIFILLSLVAMHTMCPSWVKGEQISYSNYLDIVQSC
jgi:hypothetical protein